MTNSSAIFGSTPDIRTAEIGSYGYPPPGFRLPEATRVGTVHLSVADLEQSISYYEQVLGLQVERFDGGARLHADGESEALVVLHEQSGARKQPRRSHLGLFHFAILLPDRPSLGRFVRHLGEIGVQAGAGDHLVSEAFYLNDPDGHGIEVYADRPRDTWRREGRELMMATDPVDVASLIRDAGVEAWKGMPKGTTMGHMHLHVGDLESASRFYSDAIGFDRMVTRYPGALFLGAGGYHHHLGTNTWAGPAAQSPTENDVRLIEWTLVVPDAAALDAVADSLARNGFAAERHDQGVTTRDPWNTKLRITAPKRVAS